MEAFGVINEDKAARAGSGRPIRGRSPSTPDPPHPKNPGNINLISLGVHFFSQEQPRVLLQVILECHLLIVNPKFYTHLYGLTIDFSRIKFPLGITFKYILPAL